MKAVIIYYSMYGHIHAMAREALEAMQDIDGCTVSLHRVPETLNDETLKKMGAYEASQSMADVPVATPDDLADADVAMFGTPTRFGNMAAQMKAYIDHLGGLWMQGKLIDKPAAVFTSSNTQHGGQESTILTFHVPLLHLGMLPVGLPYSFKGQMTVDEITGCSPYGASTIAGPQGGRTPSQNERDGVRFQAQRLVQLGMKLTA